MKFSVTSLLMSALAIGLAQAACESRSTGCSPDSVCQALLSSGQVCGSTGTSSGCSTSGGTITCQCCS